MSQTRIALMAPPEFRLGLGPLNRSTYAPDLFTRSGDDTHGAWLGTPQGFLSLSAISEGRPTDQRVSIRAKPPRTHPHWRLPLERWSRSARGAQRLPSRRPSRADLSALARWTGSAASGRSAHIPKRECLSDLRVPLGRLSSSARRMISAGPPGIFGRDNEDQFLPACDLGFQSRC